MLAQSAWCLACPNCSVCKVRVFPASQWLCNTGMNAMHFFVTGSVMANEERWTEERKIRKEVCMIGTDDTGRRMEIVQNRGLPNGRSKAKSS
jgi:hypothetical protein